MSFLDASILRWFLKPYFAAGRLTLKVATRTGAMALKLADRVLGLEFLQDLSEFFLAFESMYDGFKERAGRVHDLLRKSSSGFVLVAAPSPVVLEEALYFHRRLTEKQMPFLAFIANRVHPDPGSAGVRGRRRRDRSISPELAGKLAETFREEQTVARVEKRALARLEVDTREKPILVPEQDQDVHDLKGLAVVADVLIPAGGAATPPRARAR
jgi:anion-transporting  ArsA/GET3 family ATPase